MENYSMNWDRNRIAAISVVEMGNIASCCIIIKVAFIYLNILPRSYELMLFSFYGLALELPKLLCHVSYLTELRCQMCFRCLAFVIVFMLLGTS